MELYRELAEAGNLNAKCTLAFCYGYGCGMIKEVEKSSGTVQRIS